MEYAGSLTAARAYARAGRLAEWVQAFLLSDGQNEAFAQGLRLCERRYFGPAALPLALLTRCCGPEEGMRFRVPRAPFEARVAALMAAMQAGVDLPPLIVCFEEGGFTLNDGNHRFEAAVRLGIPQVDAIVWTTGEDAATRFLAAYGASDRRCTSK